jgi:GTP-binding protein EngB required for normal cell division
MTIQDDAEHIFRKIKEEDNVIVKIAFFGQPGSGKSSLINAIIGEDVAKVGVETDVTRQEEPYEWNNLSLVDLPGYGTTEFPATSFIERFKVNSFDISVCVSSNKFTAADASLVKALLEIGKTCIFVRNKCDSLFQPGRTKEEMKADIVNDLARQIGAKRPIIFTSCATLEGLSGLQDSILAHLKPAKKNRYTRSAKAYSKEFLQAKRESCYSYVTLGAGASAMGNLVPIPAIGVAVDLASIVGLFVTIRRDFGLMDANLAAAAKFAPTLGPAISNIVRLASNEGVAWLLKQYGGRVALKETSKYIPLVGQFIAATVAFGLVKVCGDKYVDSCYDLSLKLLELEIKAKAESEEL